VEGEVTLTHETAARALRILAEECGNLEHHDALNFMLDELKASQKEARRLAIELDVARKEISNLVYEETRSALRAVKAVAKKGQ
jgi:hypothetical protein